MSTAAPPKVGEMKADSVWGDDEEAAALDAQISSLDASQLHNRVRMLENNVKVMRSELSRLAHEVKAQQDKIKDNHDKIKMNKQLPYLVANVIEILDLEPEVEEDGAAMDTDSHATKAVVIKTSTRQTVFLPVVGLVDPKTLKPGDLVGVNKDSYLILDTLPAEYDSRVKAMEVDEKPTEDYTDVGGLDKQIQELVEAVVRPMTHADLFKSIGIRPPKGVLLYGPPGTGKTLLARACAAKTNACFLKLAAPQLVQMFIGDGAKLVRDAFALAHEKAPAIIFIDELDAIGTKRFDSDKCFETGTRLRLYNGDTIAVDSLVGGEQLMGPDGAPRAVVPASVVRGRAQLYTITPKWTGAAPFTVTGNHVLVLIVNDKPFMRELDGGRGRVEWWEPQTVGAPVRRSHTTSSRAAREELRELLSEWEPIEFDITVDDFLQLPQNTRVNAAKLFAAPAVTFAATAASPRLRTVLSTVMGVTPSAEQLAWIAWYLGMWVTDGAKRDESVSHGGAAPPDPHHHHEIFARLLQYQSLFGESVRPFHEGLSSAGNAKYRFAFGINTVARRVLDAYGLIGNKHIPMAWICDTVEVRRRILAGIIDGDGHYSAGNDYLIPGKDQAVVQGYKVMAASLGLRNSKLSITRCVNEDGEEYRGFCVALSGHMWDVVQYCTATCKRCPQPGTAGYVEKQCDSRCYGFTIKKESAASDYYGFAVSGNDRRFLLADFTVTHNSGDREVQRTMLELLNQLDGFSSDDRIKVIAATNRPDILDPALLRSGRLDRKIEFPLPDEEGRAHILRIHSNKMNVNTESVNYEELARCTDDFNGAMLKAVAVEAGMLALRRDATELNHEDFMAGIAEVQAKKKANLNYYA